MRRPDPVSQAVPFGTPNWQCAGGLYAAMPRDLLLVIGDEIIESPMATGDGAAFDAEMIKRMVPVQRAGSTLIVAMSDPSNIYAIDDLKFLTGLNIEPVVTTEGMR